MSTHFVTSGHAVSSYVIESEVKMYFVVGILNICNMCSCFAHMLQVWTSFQLCTRDPLTGQAQFMIYSKRPLSKNSASNLKLFGKW